MEKVKGNIAKVAVYNALAHVNMNDKEYATRKHDLAHIMPATHI